jgi:membrane dipeptidase
MVIIDGLQCSTFTLEYIETLHRAGVSCVTPTLAFWEGAVETMDAISRWRDLERSYPDSVAIVRTRADYDAAVAAGKLAVLLGTQNASLFDDRIRFVDLFYDMGIRSVQLTYNIQNAYGSACYDDVDGGLTGFGRQLVREMSQVGMLLDLSHVGNRTSLQAIEASPTPVSISHSAPAELFAHPRSKATDVLKALAERGGMLGLPVYPNLAGPWSATVDRWCELVIKAAEIVGFDHLGIGTDLSVGSGEAHTVWVRQGRWSRDVQYGAGSPANPARPGPPSWFSPERGYRSIADGLTRAGLSTEQVAGVMGENWQRLYLSILT